MTWSSRSGRELRPWVLVAAAVLLVFLGRLSVEGSSGVRKTWTGWQQGGRRRRWDVTLTAGDFAALQYALAAAGVLQLRG